MSRQTAFARVQFAIRPLLASLRGRLALLLSLATVPSLLITVFISTVERTATLERLSDEARHVGRLAAREHSHQLEGAKSLLLRLTTELSRPDGTPGFADAYLRALQASHPQFANIGLLTATGDVLVSAVDAPHHLNMAANPVFARALGSRAVEVGTYTIGPIVNRPVLHLAHSLPAPDGRGLGVAFIALELSWLQELARATSLPAAFSLQITDRDGAVLAGSSRSRAEPAPTSSAALPIAKVLENPTGLVLEIGTPPAPHLFVATPLGGLPDLFVLTGIPYAHVQAEANEAFFNMLLALTLVMGLTLASALLAADLSVLRVLRTLTRASRRLGAGDLACRAPLPRARGELRELAVAFNGMAQALASRQHEIEESEAQLRALSHRIQTARDTEAGRIARELHDELGQVLTSLKLELSRIRRTCSSTPYPACQTQLGQAGQEMSEHLDSAIDFIRRVASELRPTVLDRLGLTAALEWLGHDFEAKSGLTVHLAIAEIDQPVDAAVSLVLFRIAQEALTNVVRHADASEVQLALTARGAVLSLEVRDDGRGLPPMPAEERISLGLLNMKERAHLVGGTWHLESTPGRGTAIRVEVPHAAGAAATGG